MDRPRVLLAQLNSNGDCLYATVLARQIKEADHKGCHLTWAVNSKCKQTVLLNPHVDEIWEVSTKTSLTTEAEWEAFVKEAEARKFRGDFDHIYYTQVIGKNIINFDGGIRSSMYNNYPYPITVSRQPVIRLSEKEIANVRRFSEQHHLGEFRHVILIECGPDSFKSTLDPASARSFASYIIQQHPGTAVILSSNKRIETGSDAIMDASVLSFRENAELTKYADLFIGCSSGISWLTTTDWAKPLNKVIITNKSSNYTFSMYYDHVYAGLPTDRLIEFMESDKAMDTLTSVTDMILTGSFLEAKKQFHHPNSIKDYKYLYHLSRISFKRGNFTDPLIAFNRYTKKNGFKLKAFLSIAKAYIKIPAYLFQMGYSRK
jgi:hypothetical protein